VSIPSAIRAQMKDTVSVRVATGVDSYNVATLGAATLVKCRVTYVRMRSSTVGGDDIRTSTILLMPDIDGFDENAEVTLPDGTVLKVKDVKRPAWPDGSRHLQVVL
jgi:hypothetical protein